MKTLISSVLVSVCVVLVSAVWAADQNQADHTAHHPDAGVAASSAPQAVSDNAAKDTMAKMDAQMKTMREMHEKMMNAKTPEERDALMAEHMKCMKDGMSMMGNMGGMGMMGGGQGKMQTNMMADMATRHQMMEKRMEMMETTMQMMMDRLPSPPTKSRK